MVNANNPYKGDVELTTCFNGSEMTDVYDNEEIFISRAGNFWIKNAKDSPSELIEVIKHNHELDKKEGKKTFYKFRAGIRDTKPFALWSVKSIKKDDEQKESILFESFDI